MGKNKKRRNKRNGASAPQEPKKKPSKLTPPFRHQQLKKRPPTALPLLFPSGLDIPKDSFLRNQKPYRKSFQAALDTAYQGFVVDETIAQEEAMIQSALLTLDELGFFRTDVTQPFGLGTKCAKTYVTRCLLGDSGTTYKYLGLRMFSHPWNDTPSDEKDAVQVIHDLNTHLTDRTVHHLSELDVEKRKRGESVQGRAGFDICLVNRMEHGDDLKPEPSIGDGKCAVSWHADSSLEHYSTIAVYQTIIDDKKNDGSDWSVALRVAHHAEGPEASRRGTDIQSTLVANTPTLSVSLTSGSAYYLLDDFNHHHQHAVVSQGATSNSSSVRFSCTHRLLRASHNVRDILGRCQKTCSLFHKKGSKIWRSEQLLLTEIESEWIRQFYIQGQQHHDLLWKHWSGPMQQLLRYWSQLEGRTKQTIDLLQLAAEARCGVDLGGRKRRDKRKKALDTLEELASRIGTARTSAIQSLYDSFAELLREREEMRLLWKKREDDHVFREVDQSQRPLAVPFEFNIQEPNSGNDGLAISPLPEDLEEMADRIVNLGRACVSGDAKYLLPSDGEASSRTANQQQKVVKQNTSKIAPTRESHCQPPDWNGWSEGQFGLEMQSPWSRLLLEGRKTIETRAYNLPPALLGKRIEIFQSQQGDTVSSLGNVVSMADTTVTRVGWCRFTHVVTYQDAALFDADQDAHWVTKESKFYPFGAGSGKTAVYGWVVGEVVRYDAEESSCEPSTTIVRRYRSLFEIQRGRSKTKVAPTSHKKKKRRRY